jgi:hypothetical protein
LTYTRPFVRRSKLVGQRSSHGTLFSLSLIREALPGSEHATALAALRRSCGWVQAIPAGFAIEYAKAVEVVVLGLTAWAEGHRDAQTAIVILFPAVYLVDHLGASCG